MKPCTDCGVRHPHWRMDFDHLDPRTKTAELALVVKLGWAKQRIEEELAKCELVCANCHRDRTWRRSGRGNTRVKAVGSK